MSLADAALFCATGLAAATVLAGAALSAAVAATEFVAAAFVAFAAFCTGAVAVAFDAPESAPLAGVAAVVLAAGALEVSVAVGAGFVVAAIVFAGTGFGAATDEVVGVLLALVNWVCVRNCFTNGICSRNAHAPPPRPSSNTAAMAHGRNEDFDAGAAERCSTDACTGGGGTSSAIRRAGVAAVPDAGVLGIDPGRGVGVVLGNGR